ncbi:MAG: lipopolysaccharide heptosyltransferase II [Planctomycetia bacterium]|nr:lipopolysaccharide heptosyltransferase II [Planctomycetia bacterium]
MNIAVFLPNWVGDVVMATPALRALRNHFADAHLIGVLRPYVADVLAGTQFLDEQLFYDPRARERALGSWSLIRRLRSRRPDMAVLLTNSLRTGMLAWASGAKRRIGYARYGRGPLLTDKLYHRREDGKYIPSPVLDDYLRLTAAAGCPSESPRMDLATTLDDERAAAAVWRRLALPDGNRVVVFNSGGAFGAAKLWPTEYFAELAARVANDLGYHVLVVCGPSERKVAASIVAQSGHPRVKSLAEEPLSIGLTKACIRRSRLMISTDSGPRHFAAAFDVPVISLFGPTHIAWSENHYPRSVHLQQDVPCGPCQERVCPLRKHYCMRELTVDRVYAAVAAQLTEARPAKAA